MRKGWSQGTGRKLRSDNKKVRGEGRREGKDEECVEVAITVTVKLTVQEKHGNEKKANVSMVYKSCTGCHAVEETKPHV